MYSIKGSFHGLLSTALPAHEHMKVCADLQLWNLLSPSKTERARERYSPFKLSHKWREMQSAQSNRTERKSECRRWERGMSRGQKSRGVVRKRSMLLWRQVETGCSESRWTEENRAWGPTSVNKCLSLRHKDLSSNPQQDPTPGSIGDLVSKI